jgi:REP element-mobilizing transposase RayT
LRPGPRVNEAFAYCLAVAAERYGITVHGWIALSNHCHLVVRDNRGELPAFLAFFHGLLARCLNAFRGRWENFWSVEPTCAVYLVEAVDRFDKLVYLLINPIADHLVDQLIHWPGACSFVHHLTGRPLTVRRPRHFFREEGTMPEEITLRAERLEGFEHLSHDAWAKMITDAVHEAENAARREREQTGRAIVGRKAILGAIPTDSPNTVEPRRNLRPHVACKNEPLRIAMLAALRAFRAAYRHARAQFVAGVRDVAFPLGTYAMKVLGARCATVPAPA